MMGVFGYVLLSCAVFGVSALVSIWYHGRFSDVVRIY